MTLRAVAVRVDITPERSFPLGGFAARTECSSGLHMALEANVVALMTRASSFVWVAIDALAITATLRDAVKDAVSSMLPVPPEAVLVVASHTHAAPAVWHGMIHPVLPAEVDEDECRRVAGLLKNALQGSTPLEATVRSGSGVVVGVSANRHRLDGPVDRSLHALEVCIGGRAVAVVFDFACHATVQGPDNLKYSPDWVGGARAEVRRRYDEAVLPVVYLPGPGGDTSTRFHRRSRSADEADRLGAIVGAGVADALGGASPRDAAPVLRVTRKVIVAARRVDFSDIGSQQMDLSNSRVRESLAEGASSREAFERADLPDSYRFSVTALRVGSMCWIHSPFEVAASLGLQISQGNGHTRVIGYTDGYNGYLADADSSRNGGYEASASYFSQPETKRIVDALASEAAPCFPDG